MVVNQALSCVTTVAEPCYPCCKFLDSFPTMLMRVTCKISPILIFHNDSNTLSNKLPASVLNMAYISKWHRKMSYQSCLYCFQQCRQPTAFYRTSLSSFKYLDTFYRCGRDSDHISEIFVQKMNQFIIFRSLVTNSVTILETSAQEPEKSPCLDRADVSPCSDWSTPADDSNYCAPVGQWATCSQ